MKLKIRLLWLIPPAWSRLFKFGELQVIFFSKLSFGCAQLQTWANHPIPETEFRLQFSPKTEFWKEEIENFGLRIYVDLPSLPNFSSLPNSVW
jgi:hypothetical protein